MADPQVLHELAELIADATAIARANLAMGEGTEPAVAAPLPSSAPADAPVARPAPAEPAQPALVTSASELPGAQGLDAIRAALGDCRRCTLCEGRRNIVFGVGDPPADLVVVGEAPGFNEDQRGEPFVGPAGEMLDKMLVHVLGLRRDQVYIANVVKCRPPDNRNPLPIEVSTCLPFLHRQIRAVQPKIMLVLGTVAFKTLFDTTDGITRSRGQWREWEGIPTMPTFHPAYLLRKPGDKRLTFSDLKEARARYDGLGGRR